MLSVKNLQFVMESGIRNSEFFMPVFFIDWNQITRAAVIQTQELFYYPGIIISFLGYVDILGVLNRYSDSIPYVTILYFCFH